MVNQDQTQIAHFRQKSLERSSTVFNFGSTVLSYTDQYKYLGVTLDEHLTRKEADSLLAHTAGGALGSVLSRLKQCGVLGLYTYTRLCNSCVCVLCLTMRLMFGVSVIIELFDL